MIRQQDRQQLSLSLAGRQRGVAIPPMGTGVIEAGRVGSKPRDQGRLRRPRKPTRRIELVLGTVLNRHSLINVERWRALELGASLFQECPGESEDGTPVSILVELLEHPEPARRLLGRDTGGSR